MKSDIQMGQWKNDRMHGEGILRYPDGRTKEGLWSKGKLKREKKCDHSLISLTMTINKKKTESKWNMQCIKKESKSFVHSTISDKKQMEKEKEKLRFRNCFFIRHLVIELIFSLQPNIR